MKRGTTPIHTFIVPFDLSIAKKIEIAYAQNNTLILTKTISECEITDNVINTMLSQEETFLFKHNYRVEIQVRILTNDDKVLSSDIIATNVDKCLSDEVLQ